MLECLGPTKTLKRSCLIVVLHGACHLWAVWLSPGISSGTQPSLEDGIPLPLLLVSYLFNSFDTLHYDLFIAKIFSKHISRVNSFLMMKFEFSDTFHNER